MRAGTLRERVTIQSFTVAQDAAGEPIKTWGNLATNPTVWANVGSRSSGERFISGGEQVQATVSHTVRLRYRDDVTVLMRLIWRTTRTLQIENVIDPDGRKSDLILMCSEVQS
jgi:SPP1 family predicted phage head-tail adaptor